MVAQRHEIFLRERTYGVTHGGRPFFAHLKGVHDFLVDWGNPEHVCLAGLYHSIYGTQYFKHRTLDRDNVVDRCMLRGLIGLHAENLVLRFCVDDHRKFTDRELLEIEAANLIEQNSPLVPFIQRALPVVSPGARLALLVRSGIG
jgi:hypothetical protein